MYIATCVCVCRYSVAITKVIGRDLDSIVVDTEKTGKDCIQFMKDQVHLLNYVYTLGLTGQYPRGCSYTAFTLGF